MDERSNQPDQHYSLEDLQRQRRQIEETIRQFKRQLAVMFTDVKDSTRYFEQYGDLAGHALVARFADLVQNVIAPHGGTVVKTAGDGVLACFEDPVEASKAALELYQAIEKHNQQVDVPAERLDARTAIHFGVSLVDRQEGGLKDIYGDVVNTTARLSKIASDAGCDLVVSREVADALLEAQGITVLDPFEEPAKGKSEPLSAYPVAIPGRPKFTPPPKVKERPGPGPAWTKYMAPAAVVIAVVAVLVAFLTRQPPQPVVRPATVQASEGQTVTWELPADMESTLGQAAGQVVSGLLAKADVAKNAKLAVMPFPDPSGGITQLGLTLPEYIRTKLHNRANAVSITQADVARALPDQQYATFASLNTPSLLQAAAQAVNASYCVTGTLSEMPDGVRLDARLVSVDSGREVARIPMTLPKKEVENLWWLVQTSEGPAHKAPTATGSARALPPLSLHVLAYTERKINGDWEFVGIGDQAKLQTGETVQFVLTPSSDCFVYFVVHNSEGQVELMPTPEGVDLDQWARCAGGVERTFPGADLVWPLEPPAGTETVYMLATYRPIADPQSLVERLKKSFGQGSKPPPEPVATPDRSGVLLASATDIPGLESEFQKALSDDGFTVVRGIGKVIKSRVSYNVAGKSGKTISRQASLLTGGATTCVKTFTIHHVAPEGAGQD